MLKFTCVSSAVKRRLRGGCFPALRLIESNRGSVLLVALSFGAVLLTVIMALSSRLSGSFDQQASRILYNEYTEFVSSMRTQLEDPFHCARMLGGLPFTPAVTAAPLGMSVARVNYAFGRLNSAVITPGWESRPGGIQIQSLQIRAPNFVPIRDVQFADTAANRFQAYRGEFMFIPRRPSINVTSNQRSYFRINLIFMVRNGLIEGCFGELSIAAQCQAIGGAFDWRTTAPPFPYPAHRCHPDLRCFAGSQGVVTSPAACTAPYRPEHVGLFQDGTNRYICQWCNPFR